MSDFPHYGGARSRRSSGCTGISMVLFSYGFWGRRNGIVLLDGCFRKGNDGVAFGHGELLPRGGYGAVVRGIQFGDHRNLSVCTVAGQQMLSCS